MYCTCTWSSQSIEVCALPRPGDKDSNGDNCLATTRHDTGKVSVRGVTIAVTLDARFEESAPHWGQYRA